MDLTFTIDPDPRTFRRRVAPFLDADPVERTLPTTVLDAVVTGYYAEWVLASVQSEEGAVVGCAVQTPPHKLIVAAQTHDAVRALARGLGRMTSCSFPGVVGLSPWVTAFATAWCEGQALTAVQDRAERLFRLDAVVAPRAALGSVRLATPDDLDLLAGWTAAFGHEVKIVMPSDVRKGVVDRIAAARAWVWMREEQAVSFLGHSPVLAGHARIGPVYTPPEHRGAGFASNLVAHVSARLLEHQVVPTLFTDLANPTSNSIYQTIGYKPVADAYEITFVESATR